MAVKSRDLVWDGERYLQVSQIEIIEDGSDDNGKARVTIMASGREYHSPGTADELARAIKERQRSGNITVTSPPQLQR